MKKLFTLLIMAILATATSFAASVENTTFSDVTGDLDANISYAAAKGAASTAPVVNGGEIRVYQNGGTFTVSAKNDVTITEIVLGSSMATSVTYAVDGGTASAQNTISANGKLTVSNISVKNNILFTCKGTDKNSRLYVNYLKVTYETGGTPVGPVDASWSVDPQSVKVKAKKTAVATISTNYNGTLSVSSNAPNIATATINGKTLTITGVNQGDAKLSITGDATASYKAINKTLDVTVLANDRPTGEIFYESFDTNDGTGGNDNQWSGTIASSNIQYDNDGWTFENSNGAKECAKIGAGSKLGSATTPGIPVDPSKTYTLTFKAAAWNGSSESTTLKLSIVGEGSISPETVTLKKGEWTDYSVTLTDLAANSKIKFTGNSTSNSRFFLDEVSVVEIPSKTVKSITVSGNAEDLWKGDSFTHNGITVIATYDDDEKEDVTSNCSYTGYDMSTAGQQTVTVSFQGKTGSYTVNVKTIANTKETAYTVAAAKNLIDAGKDLVSEVFVKGIVCQVDSYNSTYGSITYWISEDGATSDQFEVYGGLGLEGAQFSSIEDVAVGDKVIVKGLIKKYNNDVYEFDKNNVLVELIQAQRYNVIIDPNIVNGSVTSTPTSAVAGHEVALTVIPAAHYHISALTVTGASGKVNVSDDYKFTMPAEDVTVSATFEEDAKYTYTWYVNGQVLKTVNAYEGADIEAPNNPATPAALTGKVFTGWVTTSTVDASVEPTYVTVDTKATATTSYYAVFATAEQKGGGNDYYEEVTSSSIPVDWTVGDYLIVSDNGNNTAYVYNGAKSEESLANCASGTATISKKDGKNVIETIPNGYAIITLAKLKSTGKYQARINGEDKYLSSNDGKDGLLVRTQLELDAENLYRPALEAYVEDGTIKYKLDGLFFMFHPTNYGFRAYKNQGTVATNPIQFYVKKAGTHIEYSDWTTGEVPATITMTGTYRSKYIDNSEIQANSYKNTVTIAGINASQFAGKTFKVTRKENSSKRGDTGKPEPNEVKDVAQVTFSDDGSQYTLTYYNQEENENRRYDGDDVATTGTTANGVVVKDYFIFNTARGGDMARCYSYNVVSDDADVTAAFDGVPQFEAPVYSGHVVAYKMVSDSKVAYTIDEIKNETSADRLAPVYGAGVEFEPFENTYFEAPYSVASQKIKRNHSDASNSENVTVTEKDGYTYVEAKPNQSDAYSVEFEVQSKDGESNYYGTNQEIVYTGVVTAQIGNFDKSTYTFGDGGHYYYCTVKANMAETVEGMFSTVGGGVRVWRVSVTEPYEVIEQFANRGSNYRFYNSVPMETNAMEITGIGSDLTEYQESSFKNTRTGVFGSKSDAPHMNFLVRFYYKENSSNSAQSARRKIAAAAGEEYYVSDKYEELDFPSNIVTGVEDVFGAKEVKSVRYFNIMGVESAEPVDGVNIVVTTYTDGTSSSAKMLR